MDMKSGIGILALVVIALGIAFWYTSSHPAPHQFAVDTATSTLPTLGSEGAPRTLNETAAYYEIHASYPSSIGLAGNADVNAVALMEQFEQDTITQFKKDGNFANLSHDDVQMMGLDQRKETLDITYTRKTGARTVSYLYTITEDTLGAHPNTFFHTFTFDRITGMNLSLTDLFVPGADYPSLLSSLARKLLPAIVAKNEGIPAKDVDTTMLNAGTTAKAESFQNWYLEGNALVLAFEPYQVAAYAAGPQTLSVPLTELGTSLRSEYQ